VLMIEDGNWKWKLCSHYEIAIENFLETRRVNNKELLTQNILDVEHGVATTETENSSDNVITPTFEKHKVTCRKDYNAIHCRIANCRVKYLFILAHGDDNEIVFKDFSIPLKEFLDKMSKTYKNLIWLHIGTCSTLVNYRPTCAYSFTISGYQT
jgi:hypothetical protein